jgi:hypothetical protein
MDFEIAVVGVGLAGKQALEFALGGLVAQRSESRFGFLDDTLIVLSLAEFNELDRVGVVLLDALIAADQIIEPGALANQLLRSFGIVPELGVLDLVVQFGETPCRDIPVKDASGAGRATSGCRRRPPGFPRACLLLHKLSLSSLAVTA